MQISPFLMFVGKAEEAMSLYTSLFPQSKVTSAERYKAGEQGKEGSIKLANFEICGLNVKCIDSPVTHAFTFTPSFSFFVDCDSLEQLEAACDELGKGGQFLMPKGNYGFSRQFAWLADRYGVSWQLNWV